MNDLKVLQSGQIFGSTFQIERLLGKGSFGAVYRANMLGAEGFAKPVAIKILHASLTDDDQLKQFRDEAEIGSLLDDHPNVASVITYGVHKLKEGSSPFI